MIKQTHMSAASKYDAGLGERSQYEDRAEENARLTDPYLYVRSKNPTGQSNGDLPVPFQSLGSMGIKNLASKLNLVVLPPNQPSFKYSISDDVLEALDEDTQGAIESGEEIDQALTRGYAELEVAKLTRAIQQNIEETNARVEMPEIMQQLLISGNICIFVDKEEDMELFHLDSFVIVERERKGRVLNLVIKEEFNINSLDQSVLDQINTDSDIQDSLSGVKTISIYTEVVYDKRLKYFKSEQQFSTGTVVEGTKFTYPKGNPYITPRIAKISGEKYGRSYVEGIIGDLRAYSGLSGSIRDLAAAAARVIGILKPNSASTFVEAINNAANGDFVVGNIDDLSFLKAELSGDFSVVNAVRSDVKADLEKAFLMLRQRDAERVTAEEIRTFAEEINRSLGNVYSMLSKELQMPLIEAYIMRMGNKITKPTDVDLKIITGIEAIGRVNDIEQIKLFIQDVVELKKAQFEVDVNINDLISRLAAARGIDTNGILPDALQLAQKTRNEELSQMDQSNAGQAMIQQQMDGQDPMKQAQLAKVQAETEQLQTGE